MIIDDVKRGLRIVRSSNILSSDASQIHLPVPTEKCSKAAPALISTQTTRATTAKTATCDNDDENATAHATTAAAPERQRQQRQQQQQGRLHPHDCDNNRRLPLPSPDERGSSVCIFAHQPLDISPYLRWAASERGMEPLLGTDMYIRRQWQASREGGIAGGATP